MLVELAVKTFALALRHSPTLDPKLLLLLFVLPPRKHPRFLSPYPVNGEFFNSLLGAPWRGHRCYGAVPQLPAKGRYSDASFEGFLVRGAPVLSRKAIPIQEVSDHFPAILTIAIH
jgi:hypothetical protein